MKSQLSPTILFSLLTIIFFFMQESLAESIAKIEYPAMSIQDVQGDELIHVEAVAELSNITINGSKVSELSDLAWDSDEQLLYALSDNGHLLSFKPVFSDNKLDDLLMVNGIALHDEKGKKLRWKNSDSEGLTLINSNN
ncbi:MAG: esterase-like activity of phytase family protein, partial [Gammaproteobacteria bacterium]|nr:esterase-like activity of phytase family protein [Gammaproteobacteria bacterium]